MNKSTIKEFAFQQKNKTMDEKISFYKNITLEFKTNDGIIDADEREMLIALQKELGIPIEIATRIQASIDNEYSKISPTKELSRQKDDYFERER